MCISAYAIAMHHPNGEVAYKVGNRQRWRFVTLFLFAWLFALTVANRAQEKGRPALVVQNGHFSDVRTIAYSPDERLIVSAGDDGAIKLWDADSGMLLRTINAGESVHSLAISPDGQTLAVGTNRQIKFWQIESGALHFDISRCDRPSSWRRICERQPHSRLAAIFLAEAATTFPSGLKATALMAVENPPALMRLTSVPVATSRTGEYSAGAERVQ